MKLDLSILVKISMVLMLLSSMAFQLGNFFIAYFIPFSILTILCLLFIKCNYLLKNIFTVIKIRPFNIFVYLLTWSILSIVVSIFTGFFNCKTFFNSVLGGLLCSVCIPFVLTIILFSTSNSIKIFIKYFITVCLLIFAFSIIENFVFYFDIPYLKELISLFCNLKFIRNGVTEASRSFVGILPRSSSIFYEPSHFAYFILTISPILYEIVTSRYKIFKSKFYNLLAKQITIPLMWFSLLLTQSPIFLIFNLIYLLYYLLIIKKKYILFPLTILVALFLVSVGILYNLDISETFFYRIIIFMENFKDFDKFVIAEPSLATRVILIINGIQIGLQNLFLGIGFGNLSAVISQKLMTTDFPLTPELQNVIIFNIMGGASSLFSKFFSETGCLGVILFYTFLYKIYVSLRLGKQYFYGIERSLVNGLELFIPLFIISSFYDSRLNVPYIWILFGVIYIVIKKTIEERSKCI